MRNILATFSPCAYNSVRLVINHAAHTAIFRATCVTTAVFGFFLLHSLCVHAETRIQSEQFDDWFYRCVTPEGGPAAAQARCEVVQIAQTKQGEETINLLTLSIAEDKANKGKSTVLTVLTPLNVYLPGGLDLSVDEGAKVTLQYRNCNNAGCWLQHIVNDKLLAALRSGQSGFARFRLINGQNLNVKFSLKGLPGAMKSLQQGQPPKEKS